MAPRLCPRMHLSGAIAALLLLFSSTAAHGSSEEKDETSQGFYLLAVTSQAVGGTNETLCVTINSRRPVSLKVDFELNINRVNLLKQESVQDFYRCVTFKVPVVTEESIAVITLHIKGSKRENKLDQEKSTKILIIPPSKLIFIETDKPIYKPGQKVNFRIVSLDSDFYTYNRVISTIELRDPNSNRIGQWLNVSTSSGMVDLSFPLSSRATNGYYTITLWKNGNEAIEERFEVKEYVLPTFEVKVEVPEVITILDKTILLKVCAKYTYGKPVSGDVKTVVCHNNQIWYWIPEDMTPAPKVCEEYTMQTDKTGCGQKVLDLKNFTLADSRYEMLLDIQSEVTEHGTGMVMKGSGSVGITNVMSQISFEDSPTTFRTGMKYKGKVKMADANSKPMKRRPVYLYLSYSNTETNQTLITDDNGVAEFSYDTERWGQEAVTITANYEKTDELYEYTPYKHTPYYPTGYLWVQPFHSRSESYIVIDPKSTPLSCENITNVEFNYVINDKFKHRPVSFFYMVMSRGHLVDEGCLFEMVKPRSEMKGNASFPLKNINKLSPHAQVVVYTLLPSGEVVADSMNFPVQPCLTNKVSLAFNSSTELPGAQTSLNLKAAPGSLCSVRALDKSLLLLQPESELTIQSVFNMLPIQMLWGYPYQVYEYDPNPCVGSPVMYETREKRSRYFPSYGKINVYNVFSGIGVKIVTNAEIRPAPKCTADLPHMRPLAGVADIAAASNMKESSVSAVDRNPNPNNPVVTVRKYFPETWIWDLVTVGQSGGKVLNKTVPHSITTWQADAFCTSPVGFGIAPKAELVSFQPFFVSVTMPSSVIRGEGFTLKATVFNYLNSCMMVSVSLADSNKFSAKKYKDCEYSRCLCADESFTVSWTITPLVLGKVSISVTAEATKSDKTLCGGRTVTVPTKGHIDTVIKSLLVKAEGTKQYKTYNELLCPSDNTVMNNVSLTLPTVFVEGSAEASVSVVGDLMGRALQNLARLLAMPGGCGEQNMLYFAPNIYILQYLESTNQLTPEILSTAKNYLVTGYQNQLTYKHSDGSYSAFGMNDPSGNTWLTAFVMKSFGGAMKYIFIDKEFVDQAKLWLGQQQQPNGCFASVGQLFHTDMKGGVNDEVTLSAYITAAMLELNYPITDPVVNNSLTCLKNQYNQVTSTYTKALLFYTFTLAGDQDMRSSLISALNAEAIVSGGGRHWSRTSSGSLADSLEVEMTSYVLLALMSGPMLTGFGLGYSTSIVYWLSQQQNAFGGYASTQDTVVALQALAKYSQVTYSPAGNITVTVTSPSGLRSTFTITQSNRLLYQEKELQEVPGDYNIRAEGKGCVYVQFALSYNIPPPPQNDSTFSISASASGNCRVPYPALEVTITVMYNGTRPRTNMVVIEVGSLSGFQVDQSSVRLVNGDSVVKRVDVEDDILVIYLDGLNKGMENQLTLTITAMDDVDHNKPAIVKVYDYYETSESAVTQYTSPCPYQ